MTNSEATDTAIEILEKITGLLDEERMYREIDERVDAAAGRFVLDSSAPVTHQRFHQVIADFVHLVYEHGLRVPQTLLPSQAHAEAVALLCEAYQGAETLGYDGALLDAVDPRHNGLMLVLLRMAEIIKGRERGKYSHWVFASNLDHSAWQVNCRIAEILLERANRFLPEDLRRRSAAQFAQEIPALINAELNTDRELVHMCASALTSCGF